MLGVMTVRREELKVREDERYRAFYCGLCHAIGKRCGASCRLALSFEMTFLSLLLTSLYEPETVRERRRCLLHPLTARDTIRSEMTDYCADISALVSYYDLLDGWEDERKPGHLAASLALKKAAKKAGGKHPEKLKAVREYVRALHEVEASGDNNLDTAANLTGTLMAELCAVRKDVFEKDLREMGFYLGKFIYLADCFEDVEQDIRKHSYNPLISRMQGETFESDCEAMLRDMMARSAEAFERLPVVEDAEILRNILYSGVWLRFENAVARRRKAKEEHERSL